MEIGYTRSFKKEYRKLPAKVKKQFLERLTLFTCDPFDPVLNNHPLHGPFGHYRSINVNGDFRALYSVKNTAAVFARINTHTNLYE